MIDKHVPPLTLQVPNFFALNPILLLILGQNLLLYTSFCFMLRFADATQSMNIHNSLMLCYLFPYSHQLVVWASSQVKGGNSLPNLFLLYVMNHLHPSCSVCSFPVFPLVVKATPRLSRCVRAAPDNGIRQDSLGCVVETRAPVKAYPLLVLCVHSELGGGSILLRASLLGPEWRRNHSQNIARHSGGGKKTGIHPYPWSSYLEVEYTHCFYLWFMDKRKSHTHIQPQSSRKRKYYYGLEDLK